MLSEKPVYTIDLPRKHTTRSLNIICTQKNTIQYSLNSPQFDPNIEKSPPNTFMQNLNERMNIYHCTKK